MCIALVPHIPDDLISRGIINPVQGNRQLHNTQVGSQMAPVLAYSGNYLLPYFSGKAY